MMRKAYVGHLYDSTGCAHKGSEEWFSPFHRRGDGAQERLSEVLTRSQKDMVSLESNPGFSGSNPTLSTITR